MSQQHRLALPMGSTIHWYEIESVLGKGGFGITYLARDKNLDKQVAIKEFLPSEFATRDPDHTVHPDSAQNEELYRWGLNRFIDEARVLSRFEHANIVRVHTVFEGNNTGYMIMAYEHGRSLKAILNEEKTLSQERIMQLLLPILEGLQLVHGKQFIHRDIKPDNIYVREDGSPVLLDFGSARQAVEGESRTMTTMVSPGYAPFEQYHSKGEEQGPWTDIYSLGATAFRAITGINPIDAVTRSRALLDGKPDPQPLLTPHNNPGYSPALLNAVNHALCFRMADRPQSLEQWIHELQDDDGATVMVGATQQAAVPEVQAATSVPVTRSESGSQRSVMLGLVGVVLVLMVGLGAYQFTQSTADTDSVVVADPQPSESEATDQKVRADEQESARLAELEREQAAAAAREQQAALARQEEEARLAEQQRQEAAARQAEQARLAEEKRQQELARQRALEQARLKAEQELEAKISQSRAELAARTGNRLDPYTFSDYPSPKPLAGSATIKVPANNKGWTSAGVMIERGKTYSISASGQWRMGKLCKPTDASGEGVYTISCWDLGGQVVPGFSHSALVGKIGKGSFPFYVGNEFTFTADRDGGLYFMANDAAAVFGDNDGVLDVTISRRD